MAKRGYLVMVAELELQSAPKKLYDTDYNLWVMETVDKLKNKDFGAIDLENLIEEVADLSRREKRRLESLLTRLFEHLLKLKYWESERNYNQRHWKKEVRNFRQQINKELKVSPSLENYVISIIDECYRNACGLVSDVAELPLNIFPEKPIATIEQVLDENWLP
jgi:hypothetical protein